jgi:hypothetical protein
VSPKLKYSDDLTTPLEIINLYLSEGRSTGDRTHPFFDKMNRELSWNALLENGYQTEISSLLYYIVIQETSFKHTIILNDSIKHKLKSIRMRLVITRLLQRTELFKIFDAFEDECIPVIPLKGSYLAETYYPDMTLRNMADIDILVYKSDIDRSIDCLSQLGYILDAREDDGLEDHKHPFHRSYIKFINDIPIQVEIHFHIALNSQLNNIKIEDFWHTATPISYKYNYVRIPCKELILLHCIWHTYLNFSKPGLIKLIWLIDIALLIKDRTRTIDWYYLEKKINEAGIHKRDYFCMELVTHLLGFSPDKKPSNPLKPRNYEIFLFKIILLNSSPGNIKLKTLFFSILLKQISVDGFPSKMLCVSQTLGESFTRFAKRFGW